MPIRPPALRRLALAVGVLGAAALAPPAAPPLGAQPAATAAARPAGDALQIPHERHTLPNGLTVLLAPDRSVPTVAVDVWYHVGSKDEIPGRTGFAHLFEHVMFTGSGHIPYGVHDRLTMGIGGTNNGSTSNDRTNYYEVVPANYLETALWLEADRMGWLLETLDSAKFVAQRDIVQNERRQGIDNVPYGMAGEILAEATYPEGHPYAWPVVGYMRDLQAASLDDVKQFFRTWYAPNNATLAIVGDFDPAEARRWVARYFGDIPRGAPIERAEIPPASLAAERRLVHEDRVQVPRLYLQWPTVGIAGDDRHALELLGAILAGPRTARLTKALVYDAQVAASVSAFQRTMERVGTFGVTVTPRPGTTLDALEAGVDSIVRRLAAEGPTADELTRAKAGAEYELVSGLEDPLIRAEILLRGQVLHGDPEAFRADLRRQQAVTAADVQRVARTYLGARRLVLSVVPQGRPEMAAGADRAVKATTKSMIAAEAQP